MNRPEISYRPIGTIHSPFTSLEQMPIQPAGRSAAPGTIEVFPEYREGLKDLDGFSHVILLYHLHEVNRSQLVVTPFLDCEPRGIFATRAPLRPNPIGLSIVKLQQCEDNLLWVDGVDVLDCTPLLDIKPYVPEFDAHPSSKAGWLDERREDRRVADGRFHETEKP